MSVEYKTPRLRDEFIELHDKNRDLFNLIDALSVWVKSTFDKDITVTSIFRTEAENGALYANTPVDQRPKGKPHCFWKAVDLRSYDFEKDELDKIVSWINTNYKNPNGRVTSFVHEVAGNTYHFHIQYKLL